MPIGLKGAFNRAAFGAVRQSKEFIIWAKNNMTKCCCEILFGQGNCKNNKE